jgi:hypothetical protein
MCKELSFALLLVPGVASDWGQIHQAEASPTAVPQTAFTYFDEVEGHRFDEFLHRLRPKKLPPELKEQVLKILPQRDVVSASRGQEAKLRALEPILEYHDRGSTIDVKIVRAPLAGTAFLAGAAILITAPALEILSAEELQATAAHELGHEYFWDEFERARQQDNYSRLQELELRCDGIAVITLIELGLNPEKVLTSFEKFNAYNGYKESGTRAERYVSSRDRERFIRSMIALVRGAGSTSGTVRE